MGLVWATAAVGPLRTGKQSGPPRAQKNQAGETCPPARLAILNLLRQSILRKVLPLALHTGQFSGTVSSTV